MIVSPFLLFYQDSTNILLQSFEFLFIFLSTDFLAGMYLFLLVIFYVGLTSYFINNL